MGLSLRPERLKRYRDLARLLIKYGRSDLVKNAGLDEALEAGDAAEPGTPAQADELAADLEALGPTYIKLGQLLSTRPDVVPPAYAAALARLQDDVAPFPSEEAERIIREELGVRISRAFEEFDSTPMAAASLGQVHSARLRGGRRVAVKVQRPGIREQIVEDLDAIEELAELADRHTEAGRRYEFSRTLGELRKGLLAELDYRREARNLETLAANLSEFRRIVVPRPVDDYTTARVLTMEYVPGRKITDLSPLALMEVDGRALADDLFRAYLQQILLDGFFHADPHPGNVFLTDDGRLALIDLGMVGTIGPTLQQELLRLMLAISDGNAEDAARTAIDLGERRPGFDREAFDADVKELVAQFATATAAELELGRVMLEVTRSAAEAGLRLPVELAMLGRALLALDQVGRTLDPGIRSQRRDPAPRVGPHAAADAQEPLAGPRLLQRAGDERAGTEAPRPHQPGAGQHQRGGRARARAHARGDLDAGGDAEDLQPHRRRAGAGGAHRGRGDDDAGGHGVDHPGLPRTGDDLLRDGGGAGDLAGGEHPDERRAAPPRPRRRGPVTETARHNPRAFIRHTVDVPLEVRPAVDAPAQRRRSANVSHGGLAFDSDVPQAPGSVLELRIPAVDPPFEASAEVVWSRRVGEAYQIGVRFMDAADAFRVRMVQQVCSIENYRREVREREGRELSTEDAAAEWIGRYAGRFPDA
jgi:ubiquinone biosynthesis protein